MESKTKKIHKLSKAVIVTEDDIKVVEKELYTTIAATSSKSEYSESDKLALRASLRALKKVCEILKERK